MRPCRMSELVGLRVVQPLPAEKRVKRNGKVRPDKKLGKVHQLVFAPNGRRVVGLLIRRPDAAGMVKRDDVFCALDAIQGIREKEIVVPSDDRGAFDDGARKRLGLDWDRCIIWAGMDARTRSGKDLGFVSDVRFDLDTGDVSFLCVGEGSLSQSLVGLLEIPSGMLVGYDPKGDGYLVVEDEAARLALSGGVAAKAGEATARMKANTRDFDQKAADAYDKGTHKLGQAVGKVQRAYREAVEDEPAVPEVGAGNVSVTKVPAGQHAASGSYAPDGEADEADASRSTADDVARKVGRQLGKTKGMFKAFKDEFDEASK
jgi:uncharacterized protein YrrD